MIRDEMTLKIRRAINEPYATNSIVIDTEIHDYLLDGATIFVRETACMTEYADNTTSANTQFYTFEDWVLKPEIVLWNNGSKWVELEYKNVRQLMKISDFQLFAEKGTPEYYFVERRQIGLYPTPTVNGANDIKMLCSRMPEALANTSSEWDEIPETYHRTINHYAISECWDKIGNETKARKHYDLFYAGIDNYKTDEQDKVKSVIYQKQIWSEAQGFIGRL